MELNRKHSRSYEGESDGGGPKRIKLDSLFNNLKIGDDDVKDEQNVDLNGIPASAMKDMDSDNDTDLEEGFLVNNSKFVINPKLKNHMIFKKSPSPKKNVQSLDINSYISNKIISHFNILAHSNLAVIKAYNPKFLLIYRFQKWMIKLFNRFISKYNKHNFVKIQRVKSYDKIISLIRQNNISFQQLVEVIIQENHLSLLQLKQRQEQSKADAAREFDVNVYNGISYKYWDNLKFDNDIEMSDLSPQKVEEIHEDENLESDQDIEMEIDESNFSRSSESNYGSYYDYDSNELMTA